MERLTGGNRKTASTPKKIETSSQAKVKASIQQKGGLGKKDNPKDILNRMKEVKAQYNNRSRNSLNKHKEVAEKVAELTNKK